MFLSEEDIALVKSGRKKAIIRFGPRKIDEGEVLFNSGISTYKCQITKVTRTQFSWLTNEEASLAGYDSVEDFTRMWAKHVKGEGRIKSSHPVTIILLGEV